MMDELIKRQDAIDKHIDTFDAIDTNYLCGLRTAMSFLKELPSAQPQKEVVAEIKVDTDEIMERLEEQWYKPNEWIPCSERLPSIGDSGVSDMVLLCWSDGQRTVGAYKGNRTFVGQAWPVARDCRVTVIAWMPLPEPYKEGEADD